MWNASGPNHDGKIHQLYFCWDFTIVLLPCKKDQSNQSVDPGNSTKVAFVHLDFMNRV